MSQLHLPHSSLRFRFPFLPSLHLRRVALSPTNSPLSLKSTKSTVFRPLTIVRSRCSESEITPKVILDKPQKQASAIFWIIFINLAIYVADHFFKVRGIKSLYLYKDFPAWYQFVTATFCHTNWNHLSGNLFLLYIFGKIVEEEKGNTGLWLSYLFTGVGANLASWLVVSPKAGSLGASGAVFGLFVISVLVKMSRGWRKFLEVLILAQFIVKRVFEETQVSAGLLDRIASRLGILTILQGIKPVAHFSGALVGVVLVGLLSRFSSEHVDQEP